MSRIQVRSSARLVWSAVFLRTLVVSLGLLGFCVGSLIGKVQSDTAQIQMATLRNGGSCLGPDFHQVKDASELLKSVYSVTPHPGFTREVETLVQKPECFDKERNDRPLLIAIDGKDRKQMGMNGSSGGMFNSTWSNTFEIPLTSGTHTLSALFMNVLYVGQQKQEVAFTAAAGHVYLLNEVFEINGPSIDKKRKSEKHGYLIVVDATDRADPKIVGVG